VNFEFDVIIVGAGAAGLMCAGVAGQRGQRVLLIDHAERVAEKIRVSGGGRCNFTNREVNHTHFFGENPNFCRSALSQFTPADFVAMLQRHGIAFHEKHKGQLFCDRSAQDIIQMLLDECEKGGVTRWQPCRVQGVQAGSEPGAARWTLATDRGAVSAHSLVLATGGLSIPKIGASDWGYRTAQQLGLRIVPTQPALVPLTFEETAWAPFAHLAGLSLPVQIETGSKKERVRFQDDLLFTHRGLSGPAVLQISSAWKPGSAIRLNLAAHLDWTEVLMQAKVRSRKSVANELAVHLPARLADAWVQRTPDWQRPIEQASDKALAALAQSLAAWELTPTGTEGYRKAEVTRGGVDTRDLSSQSLEARSRPGLFCIGEVVDVTGWLGGYNFQWAWSSAYACAHALQLRPGT
jgi:predicted Rossmann fold flavoprotein